MMVDTDLIAQPATVYSRVLPEGNSTGFEHHVVEGDFYFAHFIETGTAGYSSIHIDAHGEVKMRGSEFAFSEAFGNHFTHL
ncbi:hypothetical protein D9M69_696910 [compost metagenome]